MAKGLVCAILAAAAYLPVLLRAADIQGAIVIERKLTKRNVTAPTGLYQRGTPVELRSDSAEDPLAYERSHVVVYIENQVPGTPAAPATAVLEQRDRRFSPDLLVIPAGSTVSFPNFDPIFHNVFSLSKAKSFDLGNYPKGQTREVAFPKPGVVFVYCHLHPNMAASIVVTPSQWATRAHGSGAFTLPNVPPGKYTVVAWHKAAGTFRKTVEVSAQSGGQVTFLIPLGPEAVESSAKR
jgi:plastocyanin